MTVRRKVLKSYTFGYPWRLQETGSINWEFQKEIFLAMYLLKMTNRERNVMGFRVLDIAKRVLKISK
jgi:hypothetical protein